MARALPIEQKFAVNVLKRAGVAVTKRSVINMIAWMRAEGGHTHNNAKFNFLNTTQPAAGAGNTGSQGNIKVYRNFDQGVNATVQTLKNGRYGGILKSFNSDPSSFASAVNATPWGTKSNFGSIASTISVDGNFATGPVRSAQSTGAPVARDPGTAASSGAVPGSPVLPAFSPEQAKAFMAVMNKRKADILKGVMPPAAYGKQLAAFTNILQQQVGKAQAAVPAAPGPRPPNAGPARSAQSVSMGGNVIPNFVPGGPIPGMGFHSTTHQTSGLSGYPAFDYMAKAGTPVGAPEGGTVFKLSGKDPKQGGSPGGPLGYSIYIQGKSGKKYFMTHLDGVKVKVGQRVKAGQQIAIVANGPSSWSSPHVHMGVNG